MNDKTTKVLEYDKIIDMVAKETGSALTRARAAELAPLTALPEIEEKLEETAEAVSLITLKGPMPLGNFYDIAGLVNLAVKGGTLTMGELLKVGYDLRVVQEVADFLKEAPKVPVISAMTDVLTPHRYLQEEIFRCILTEDEMSDKASPELAQIRRKIQRQNEALKQRLNQILHSQSGQTYLQDAIVTIRDGRYVVPVKAAYRQMVPGIIHDQSSSGQTLFIEPQSVVDMNNELRQLELEEQAEIARILRDLSERVAEHHETMDNNQRLLVQLDLIQAKGKAALAMRAERPVMDPDGVLELKQARHPLIDPEKVVPIDITLGREDTALIITGPNTGGKTVTLKTCGLLSMMAQTGLFIPAWEGSRIPVFQDVFADIGDEQSIEQSLSTFSSHMGNIVEILREADEDTLVLIDELGAGTDPTEGAALAISILEELIDRKARVLATTHYTELKKFALTKEGVGNASMQFDVESLSPTYKLILGLPGRSNAFEISRKLGLPDHLIGRAASLVDEGEMAFEEVLSTMERDRKAAEKDRDEATLLRSEAEQLREELEKERRKTKDAREKILAEARAEAREKVREAEELSREIKEELRELAKLESLGERNKRVDNSRRKIKDAAGRYREIYEKQRNDDPVSVEDLVVGDRVKVVSLGKTGEVAALPDKKGEVLVTIGALKVKVKGEDLTFVPQSRKKKRTEKGGKTRYGSMYRAKAQTVKTSLDVKGKNLDDALMEVGKYIDDAFMAGLPQVTIIHGRGEGILMQGIRETLKKHPNVKSFRKGSFDEGGDGVTVLELKR